MRRQPIDAETALWWRLRKRQISGFRFRRQHPVGRFIADFVCLEAKLIVEVDGIQHRGSESDIYRTEELRRSGFDVIRFENDRVRAYIDAVCDEILATIMKRVSSVERRPSRNRRAVRGPTPLPPPSGAPSPTGGEG
jgi:very-short-patch-repair endonuclease